MKSLIYILSAVLVPAAAAMTPPTLVVNEIEANLVPRIKSSNEFQLTKVPRVNSSGRQVLNGTCTFSNGEVSISIEYCDMARPEANKIDYSDLNGGETHSIYVERNSSTQFPHFKFFSKLNGQLCYFTSFYGNPTCSDGSWSEDVIAFKSYNVFNEAPRGVMDSLMVFASRLEAIDRALRAIARSRP